MSPQQILERLLELLPSESRWCRNLPSPPGVRQISLANGIIRASMENGIPAGIADLIRVKQLIEQEIQFSFPGRSTFLGQFNEDPRTTFEDIRFVIEMAQLQLECEESVG